MVCLWKAPPAGLLLPEKEVHIWQAALDLPGPVIQELSQTLSIDELERAQRFRFERDRKWFIAARGSLRTFLSHYLGVEPSTLRFCYGKHGKPRLVDPCGNGTVHFNVSRSEGLALYGFTRDHEIGVDIERIREIPEMEHIANQFFSIEERAIFCSLPESKKKEAFFNCWTRKEAFLKATGEGLFRRLRTFAVSLVPGQPTSLLRVDRDFEAPSRWSIKDLDPAFGFAAAFAVEGRRWRLHCWQWLS